jgi:peptide/nickel transport system substrate-binding protein
MSAVSQLFWTARFAYDTLVHVDEKGQINPQLATAWEQTTTEVKLTIKDGVTCSDGSPFTAETAAANINFIADPENASPLLGAFLPAGVTAQADGSTLTLTLGEPAPFVVHGLADIYMVCDAGLADRSTLAGSTNGTGPYVLTEAVPGDHYNLELRSGYTWGPNGATTAEKGLPAEVVIRIIENETTVANMLINKELNAALIFGAEGDRLESAGLTATGTTSIVGQMWYNHAADHLTSDPAVRQALAQSVDLAQLRQVLTSGNGVAPTTFTVSLPQGCPGDSIGPAMPEFDVEAAKAKLEAAGWKAGSDGVRVKDGKPLTLTFLADNQLGDGATAAAEFAVAAWAEAGIKVEHQLLPQDQLASILFGSGAWDIVWEPVNTSNPDQIVGFVSGPSLADGGSNFASIDNAAYKAKVAEAIQQPGAAGCTDWLAAETELIKATDVTVFANNVVNLWTQGAKVERVSSLIPTSIRMGE